MYVPGVIAIFALLALAFAKADLYTDNFEYKHGCAVPTSDPEIFTLEEPCVSPIPIVVYHYNKEVREETGWMPFFISPKGSYLAEEQWRAIGYVEGFLFQHHAYNHYSNVFDFFRFHYLPKVNPSDKFGEFPQEVFDWVQSNMSFIETSVKESGPYDPYWRQIGYTMQHARGCVSGYNAALQQRIERGEKFEEEAELEKWDLFHMFLYMSAGDLLDIKDIAVPKLRTDWANLSERDFDRLSVLRDHCSGLILMLPDKSDVLVSQDAWFSQGSATRVMKTYDLYGLNDPTETTKAKSVQFSSYPLFSYSFDDAYITTGTDLAIIETTNNIYNTNLYNYSSTNSVLTWIRSGIATRMANSGKEWSSIFSKFNSGSYNNGFLIADFKRFEPGKGPQSRFLHLLEQIPGLIQEYDVTSEFLSNGGYWGSYNIPRDATIYRLSGYSIPKNEYFTCPRARIFKRDVPKVKNIEDFKALMRSNDYKHDEISAGEPGYAISSRYDLRDNDRRLSFGAFDCKVISYALFNKQQPERIGMHAISGPTSNVEKGVPKFIFHDEDELLWVPHRGIEYTEDTEREFYSFRINFEEEF